MKYENLVDFIEHRMRMAHIYQPVMLLSLLKNKGQSSVKEIAQDILGYDQSQNEYYQGITNNMVGRVLRSHNIAEKSGASYQLLDYNTLSEAEIDNLTSLCQKKLDGYIQKRGGNIWTHRRKSTGYVSGTIRYEVLKKAKFHCELCGISADQRALEVDHIVPRNKGGSDELSNFQALCYRCNSMKRDRDDTDFRIVHQVFKLRDSTCLFCNIDEDRIVQENELFYAIEDAFPVTKMHSLIITKRHVASYFDLGQSEINACTRMLNTLKKNIRDKDSSVGAFNIGVNDGPLAGQTIPHCHIHLIPRRTGDTSDPRGGVRGVIPSKRSY